MAGFGFHTVQEWPLRLPAFRKKAEAFLAENGLRLEPVESWYVIENEAGDIVAGGGLDKDIIKCIAVSEQARGEGLMAQLVSHLLAKAGENGYHNIKVYTKPANRSQFEDLGFHLLAQAPEIILLENGRGLQDYCNGLAQRRISDRCGVVVINADPMTLGHKYLIEQAAARIDHLYVIVLGGDRSRFTADARLRLVKKVCRRMDNVSVLGGGDYCISPATFPSYFLKNLDSIAEQQMRLDLDLFARHIAPALRAWVRFVGSEPLDPMTARYNEIMREVLGAHDMEVREIPRLERDGRPVSASEVRSLLDAGDWTAASHLCPGCARPYLLGDVAAAALRLELDAPDKPGMVCPDSRGSHDDMDYDLMLRSIEALRPYFVRLAAWGAWQGFLFGQELIETGLAAEQAMLRATGGVNTHKGALFSLGLTAAAAGRVLREDGSLTEESLRNHIRELAETIAPLDSVAMRQTHGTDIARDHTVRGALDMALDGYRELFADWLPYWREVKHEKYGLQKTLLRILSTLDDTCVIHRAGYARAQEIKAEAAALLADFDPQELKLMDRRFVSERVSPGGSADMLALTIYVGLLINN